MAAVPSIGRANRVEGAPAPDADLTRALYEQYATQIFRYCLHQLGSREEAEDAVQSTFLNAFRGIKRGIVPEIESAWLFKIAHNVCLSRRRSTWRRDRIESPTDFDVVEELTPAPSRRADELIGLQDVLEQMPEQQRRAILLREWQGLSYREIGEELQLSQAAVETLIFRARRSLAQGLEQPVAVETRKRSRMHAGVLGNILSSAQSFLLGGGAAVKVAAVVAVASASTVVATAPVHQRAPIGHSEPSAGPVQSHDSVPAEGGASGVVVPPADAGGMHRRVPQQHAARQTVHEPAPAAPLVSLDPSSPAAPTSTTTVDSPTVGQPAVGPTVPQAQSQRPAAPPSAADTGKAAAPGQQPAAPGNSGNGGSGGDNAPGPQTKDGPAQAATTPAAAAPASPGSSGHGGNDNSARDNAPGQQKKDDSTPAATAPAPSAPAALGNTGSGGDNAPGQQKKDIPTPGASAPTPSAPVNSAGGGNDNSARENAPGQQKQDATAAPPTPATVAGTPLPSLAGPPQSAPIIPFVATPAPVPSPPANNGNGNGNGADNGNGKGKGPNK